MIIAVDGSAGSGKSTVAKLIASELDYLYIDTGAMYRAVTFTWLKIQELVPNFNFKDKLIPDKEIRRKILSEILGKHHEKALDLICQTISISFENSDSGIKTFINDIDVSDYIRSTLVTQNVSHVASYKEVRDYLVSEQRKIAEGTNIIMDGRDIGTVVFPNANLKIFLTASVEVRAKRRMQDLSNYGEETSFEEICAQLKRRDHLDSTREESPLTKAEDAVEIDTDGLSIVEVKDKILSFIN
ncbi:MAG: (d)CMP kinase [Candidatus Caenarcaniphilales bacterium]|nr:(d)CMP kinase [Candidatus Caenarcaniphilales bacterium]